MTRPELSIVIPVCNEESSIERLAEEVASVMSDIPYEILFVDDGSTDGTADAVRRARARIPQIRLLCHSRRAGQSAAVHSGAGNARSEWIATIDGDGQNDPADIPRLLAARHEVGNANVKLFAGHRVTRRDTVFRRIQARLANSVRRRLLGDRTPDTGCGLKLMHRETFLELPRFDHMHRFLPALFLRAGAEVISVPVNHRARSGGASKYGLLDRLWVGVVDILGVMWLARRHHTGLVVSEDSSGETS